jgi:hypothetical protein
MNLCNAQVASPGRDKNSGGGAGIGASAAAPAHPYVLGQIGFSQAIQDSMAASIVRLERENEELRAEVALAEAERIELAKQLRSERKMHAACQNERDALADELRKGGAR